MKRLAKIDRVKRTRFDDNHHGRTIHYDRQLFSYYVRHEVDIYNTLKYKGESFDAVYQTGGGYRNNDYSSPHRSLGLSVDGGTDRVLILVSEVSRKDLKNPKDVAWYIDEINNKAIQTAEDILALIEALEENAEEAEGYFDNMDLDDTIPEGYDG